MNIARVIRVERSVTPVIFAIFQEWTVCYFVRILTVKQFSWSWTLRPWDSILFMGPCAPVLIALKPDDTQPARYDAHDKPGRGHWTEHEEVLEERDEQDKDEAADRSCKHPPHGPVGSA